MLPNLMQNRYWIYICKEILYDKKGRSIHEIAKKREQTPQYWISLHGLHLVLHQFSSVSQSCPTLCDPTDCSIPGFPAHQQLLELAHTHAHPVSDAIQPSHPLSSPSPPTFNLSQHQDLLKWVNSSHQVAVGLEFQLQNQSFQWIFRTDFL